MATASIANIDLTILDNSVFAIINHDFFHLLLQKSSPRCLQDVLIKAIIFPLLIHLQQTSSRRPKDVFIKANIFILVKRLKTSSRYFQDVFKSYAKTSSKHLQGVFKTSCKNVFKTFSRRIPAGMDAYQMHRRLIQYLEMTLADVLKTSFVFIFRRRLQDACKTFWSRKTYFSYSYVFRRRLKDIL